MKVYEPLFVDVIKFEAQDVITASVVTGSCHCVPGSVDCANETCHIYNPNPPAKHDCANSIWD